MRKLHLKPLTNHAIQSATPDINHTQTEGNIQRRMTLKSSQQTSAELKLQPQYIIFLSQNVLQLWYKLNIQYTVSRLLIKKHNVFFYKILFLIVLSSQIILSISNVNYSQFHTKMQQHNIFHLRHF